MGRKCSKCRRNIIGLPFECKRCGNDFCGEHRLPEDHSCFRKKPQGHKWFKTSYGKHSSDYSSVKQSGKNSFKMPNIRKYKKYLPLIGLIALIILYLYINQPTGIIPEGGNYSSSELIQKNTQQIIGDLKQSFDFSDKSQTLFTFLLLFTLWTGYLYWMKKYRIVRRNLTLTKILLFAISLLIFSKHILLHSFIGGYFDKGFFIVSSVAIAFGTFLSMKFINSIDLRSDLSLWGLRLFGAGLLFFGWITMISASFTLTFANQNIISQNITWIFGVCLLLLGAFCGFRSLRRYPMIGIWQ